MKKLFAVPLIASLMLGLASGANATPISFEATNNATVQVAGPRTGASGKSFFNFEGSNNGNFSSFGVADFDFSQLLPALGPITTINSVALQLTESNAAFSAPGPIGVYLSGNTTASIEPAPGNPSPPKYQSLTPEGTAAVDPVFSPLSLLGTGSFPTTGNVNSGQVDSTTLTFTGPDLTALLNAINSHGILRLVLTENAAAMAATYAGYTNATLAGPTLVIDAVPEPASLILFAVGLVGLTGYRFATGRH